MSTSAQPTKVDGRTTTDQIRSVLNLRGVAYNRRYQELQKTAQEVCKEFFEPESQWKDISSTKVAKAREAIQDRDSLLKGRDDLAHWFISKCQKTASYNHRQRLKRSSGAEPSASGVKAGAAVQGPIGTESQDAEDMDAGKGVDAVRNEDM